jgi:hypothetical protein
VIVANNLDELHSDAGKLNNQTALTEEGGLVSGRGDRLGSTGTLTRPAAARRVKLAKERGGSAIVGHHDRAGLKDTRHVRSRNLSHGSRGRGQEQLTSKGGAGRFYRFLADRGSGS